MCKLPMPSNILGIVSDFEKACEILGHCTMSALRDGLGSRLSALLLPTIKPMILILSAGLGRNGIGMSPMRDASPCDKCKVKSV
jgi:hypothetical protein